MSPEERLENAIEDLGAYRDGLGLTFQFEAADQITNIMRSLALARNAIMRKRPVRNKPPKLVVDNVREG